MMQHVSSAIEKKRKSGFLNQIVRYKLLYVMFLPAIFYFVIFSYLPMFGIVIAFQNFRPYLGLKGMISNPNWVGFKHFLDFFDSYYFGRLIRNTLLISIYKIVFGFPMPIIFALMLNEVYKLKFKKTIQTISYLPHFLSWVVIGGLVTLLLSSDGLVNRFLILLGNDETIQFIQDKRFFRGILVISDIWAGVGWGSIIYIAGLASLNIEIYESAIIDGANRFQRIIYISLPGISNLIAMMLIFAVGGLMSAGFEQVLVLQSPAIYEVGDIIDTFVYRVGLLGSEFSYGTAIGLFKNIISLILIILANYAAKKLGNEGLF
jgi:putative aldouronate transport system permease protein